jgi:hypothetical protein
MQSSPIDRTTEFTLLQRKKTKHLDNYQALTKKADKSSTRTFWVVFTTWTRVRGARPILGYFNNQMRAKELKRCLSSQSQVFSGLDESKTDRPTLEPILGCFHDLDESQRSSPYPKLFYTG